MLKCTEKALKLKSSLPCKTHDPNQTEKSKDKPVRFFSSGMKQRLKLVLAICSDSPLLLLDEPTTNLDYQGMNWYRELIEKYGKGRSIIIASNVEADYDFCDETLSILNYKKKKIKKKSSNDL